MNVKALITIYRVSYPSSRDKQNILASQNFDWFLIHLQKYICMNLSASKYIRCRIQFLPVYLNLIVHNLHIQKDFHEVLQILMMCSNPNLIFSSLESLWPRTSENGLSMSWEWKVLNPRIDRNEILLEKEMNKST